MLKIKKNEVFLKDHTSFKVGGPCNFFADTRSLEDIKNALFFSKEMKIPFIVMGEGTNILVSDSGFDGLIIKISLDDYYFDEDLLVSEAGTHLGDLVNSTINKELSGLEWAGGLPGSLGGAVRGNAGAFGKCIADNVTKVTFMTPDGELHIKDNKECNFGYRNSFFKQNPSIITHVEIKLEKGDPEEIKKSIFKNISYRVKSHPIEYPCAGSIFKNIDNPQEVSKLINTFPELQELSQKWKGKVTAAFLLEKSGLKGYMMGGAQVSPKHSNFIINANNAKSIDIYNLINLCKKNVSSKFGIRLEPEIQLIGFNSKE